MTNAIKNGIASAGIVTGFAALLILFSSGQQDLASIIGSVVGLIPLFFLAFITYPLIMKAARRPDLAFLAILVVYYSFGIFPLTTYRGYIDQYMWSMVLALAIASYLSGRWLASRFPVRTQASADFGMRSWLATCTLAVSLGCALWIVATHGLVIFNPEARFGISAKLSYLVELSIPVVISKYCYDLWAAGSFRSRLLALPTLTLIMLLSLGYRNQPILLVIGLVMATFMSMADLGKLKKYRLAFSVLLPSAMFAFGASYLIRTNNSVGRTLDWKTTIREFDVLLPEFTLPYVPLHLAAREGMGVAESSLQRIDDISGYVQRSWFFFSDFLTLLPGYSTTSGRVLGMVVNGREDSSLTPSILGGLMIGYGYVGVIVFFLLSSFVLGRLVIRYNVHRDPRTLSLLTIFFIYMLELMNRGIFKPMYLIVLLVVTTLFRRSPAK